MSNKNTQLVTCSSCNQDFAYYEGEKPTCPNCDADLLYTIVSLGIGWMLGDWFGLWGED